MSGVQRQHSPAQPPADDGRHHHTQLGTSRGGHRYPDKAVADSSPIQLAGPWYHGRPILDCWEKEVALEKQEGTFKKVLLSISLTWAWLSAFDASTPPRPL
eukprot:TRINITY_DN33921_c0_g1_i1.p2 TRINITY_DN33921_c0_g1~~TRINITY_DN33921_c0_g1_i1.p2  ORF type:complete len:101 (-),score=1.08 TRINITY_DN33921_c0_g1_i1:84-386(-)